MRSKATAVLLLVAGVIWSLAQSPATGARGDAATATVLSWRDRDELVRQGEEARRVAEVLLNDDLDSDGDGLTDAEERKLAINPDNTDTDGDGLSDGDEVHISGSNPRQADTDDDGLSDGDEVHQYHTNPTNPDTDFDGVNDGQEVRAGADPLRAPPRSDGLVEGRALEVVIPAAGAAVDRGGAAQ